MSFPAIEESSDPEEYSWEVTLGAGQELGAVDDHNAAVYYTGSGVRAFPISATAAHDAHGFDVPTSLAVSGGNVITLTVHHRAGNPAAGGSPFVYPVIAGEGWDLESGPVVVTGPKDEQELREERERAEREKGEVGAGGGETFEGCLVPKLKGRTLKASKERLEGTRCRVGKVRKLEGATARTGRVVRQNPKPGVVVAPGTSVGVTLGVRP